MDWADEFLAEREADLWTPPKDFPRRLTPGDAFFQRYGGSVVGQGLEVVLASASQKPSAQTMRDAYRKRWDGRGSPVLVVVGYPATSSSQLPATSSPPTSASQQPTSLPPAGSRMTTTLLALCGPTGDNPSVLFDQDVAQIERLADCALAQPDQLAAIRMLQKVQGSLAAPRHMQLDAGLRNMGLLATQELRSGLPQRSDWPEAQAAGRSVMGLRGRRLAEGLGFRIEQHANHVHLLKVDGHSRAAAVFCNDDEPFDAPARRFDHLTPVSLALAHADMHGADWVVLTRGSEIRLYAARPDTGVGRKGRTETFVEANLALLSDEQAGYLHLLFSAAALDEDGIIEEILESSDRFAADLAVRLRDRVYDETVPALAAAVAARMGPDPAPEDLRAAYEQVMVILFRLLFVAYAEARDLFPYTSNTRYADHSLTRLVARLTEDQRSRQPRYDQSATSMWTDIKALWAAVDTGNVAWALPAYNGGLFARDREVSASGAAIEAMAPLTDAELAPALSSMLIDDSAEGVGPVDFRSLSVRTFGTIYEGLLESQLSLAEQDLAVRRLGKDSAPTFVPAADGDEVEVPAGSVYFHNRSGVRKSTGSYFTKPFAVKHLLDHALEPALDDHLERLDALAAADDTAGVEQAFFDFRCADIAMGSGHFLVAAVDRIERRLTGWLSRNPVPASGVNAQLRRLQTAAIAALGDFATDDKIETGLLLRRQVARHCIYGVDLNRVAVELARLSIWVHTFVPGLPLSFLDHNLVQGNSLTGIGTLDEVLRIFEPKAKGREGLKAGSGLPAASPSLFRGQLTAVLDAAGDALSRLALTADATKAEIEKAREAHRDATDAVAPAVAIFDVVAAHRAGACDLPESYDRAVFERVAATESVRRFVKDFKPVHFPAVFAEVFRRDDRSGFDCLLGNPPWEQVVVQEHAWWGLHDPGLRGLPVGQMKQRIAQARRQRQDLERAFERDSQLADIMRVVLRAAFPGLGSGRTDLYQVFSWANLDLARQGGRVGIVVPRTALNSDGMAEWRLRMTDVKDEPNLSLSLSASPSSDVSPHAHQPQGLGVRGGPQLLHGGAARGHAILTVATCLNTGQWAFDDVDGRYTVALVAARKANPRSEPWGRLRRGGRCRRRRDSDSDISRPGKFAGSLLQVATGRSGTGPRVGVSAVVELCGFPAGS
ncbi:MAG: hypothetical protein OXD37_02040 [Acidimicrobiaceae bacterium]|nr:hypothetical protein [Acidimicrobiaceae bacterium]